MLNSFSFYIRCDDLIISFSLYSLFLLLPYLGYFQYGGRIYLWIMIRTFVSSRVILHRSLCLQLLQPFPIFRCYQYSSFVFKHGTFELRTSPTFFLTIVSGRPPDFVAFIITILMMLLMAAGVKKSLVFNNVLNAINLAVWVFVMAAGMFYVDSDNWSEHKGFLPYGWSGVSVRYM